MTAFKNISLCLLAITFFSGSSFASASMKDSHEDLKRNERIRTSYKAKEKSRKRASLLQDIRDADAARHARDAGPNSISDDELPSRTARIAPTNATSSKKQAKGKHRKSKTKVPAYDLKVESSSSKKFLPVPTKPKQEMKESFNPPLAPFKPGSSLEKYWLRMERENPELYKVEGNTPYIKTMNNYTLSDDEL